MFNTILIMQCLLLHVMHSGWSLHLSQTRQVSPSRLNQAVGSLSIKPTVCLSPWVPTQQTLRAARGLHSNGAIDVTSEK